MPALGPLISYLTFLPEDRYIVDRLLPPWVKKDQFIDLHIGIMDLANIFSPGAYATGIIRGDYSAHHDDWLHDISAVAVKAHFKDVAERLFTGPAAMFQSVPSALYPKEEPWYSIEESQQEDCAGMVRVHLRLQCSRLWTERGRLERNLSGLEAALGMMMDVLKAMLTSDAGLTWPYEGVAPSMRVRCIVNGRRTVHELLGIVESIRVAAAMM